MQHKPARRIGLHLTTLLVVVAACGPAATPLPSQTTASQAPASPTAGATAPASPSPVPSTGSGWLRVTDQPVLEDLALEGAIWTGSRFIVRARNEPVLFDSADGRTWHRQQPFETNGRQSGPTNFAADPRGVIGVGGGSNVELAFWQSPDGLTWTAVPHQGAFDARDAAFQGVSGIVGTDSGWVAVGSELYMCVPRCPLRGLVLVSDDGAHWTRLAEQPALRHAEIHAIARVPSGFIAVGTQMIEPEHPEAGLGAALWTSPDGRAWTSAGPASTFPVPELPGWSGTTDVGLHDVAVLGERVVLLGDVRPSFGSSPTDYVPPLAVSWSLVGGAWTPATVGAYFEGQQVELVAGSVGFLAMTGAAPACASGLWESGDGARWQCTGVGLAFDGYVVTGAATSPTVELLVGNSRDDPVVGAAWIRPAR